MGETLLFYVFSAAAIVTSAMVIGQRNPMYSVLLLVASFGMMSGLYVLLDAPFIAVTQIIVYAGALMVLFLFVVMLLNRPNEDEGDWDAAHPLRKPGMARFGAGLGVLLIVQIVWALLRTRGLQESVGHTGDGGSVRAIGRVLFQDYTFAFEATSILILVALVGGVYLANREDGQ
ncbi:MAG: NADH-quinone oxidoreductase subunit J [Vicinamibacterales bacterium]